MALMSKKQLEDERQLKLRSKKTVYDTSRSAIVYARQSSKEQVVQHKESALIQSDDLIAYAVEQGWSEDHIILFIENMIDKHGNPLTTPRSASGRLDIVMRPGLKAVEQLVEEGKVSAIFCRDISRLFRDEQMVGPVMLARTCKMHQCIIVSYDQAFDFNASARDDLSDFLSEAQEAANFLRTQRRTLHRARERKGLRGEFAGHCIPAGYMLDDRRKQYIVNPLWAPVVASLFRRFRELDADLAALRSETRGVAIFPELPEEIIQRIGLIQMRHITGGYTLAARDSLIFLLTNPVYIGHMTFMKRIVKYNAHPAIVDLADYEYALAHLGRVDLEGNVIERQERAVRYTQGMKREGLLSGVRATGQPVLTSSQGNVYVLQHSGQAAYAIKNGRDLLADPYKGTIAVNVIDGIVGQRLEEKLRDLVTHAEAEQELGGPPEYGAQAILSHVSTLRQQVAGSLVKLEDTCKEIEKKIAQCQHEYAVARDVMSDTDIKDHFGALAKLRSRLADVKEKQAQAAQVDQDIIAVTTRLAQAKDRWQTMTLDQRRAFVKLITEQVTLEVLSGRWMKLTITWNSVLAGEEYTDCALLFRPSGAGPNWSAEEDGTLKEFYPGAPRSDLLMALPRRSWDAITSRASALHIARTTWEAGTLRLPNKLAVDDVALMEQHSITQEQIAAGVTHWWVNIKREDGLGQAAG